MFRGYFEHTIDSKGRISVPAGFRTELANLRAADRQDAADEDAEDSVMVTNFVQNEIRCLDVYPMPAWEQVEEAMLMKERMDPEARQVRNFYLGRACPCPVDKQGRILLPQHLRSWANLKRDVIFVPDLDRFQIWDKETYEKYMTITETEISQSPKKLNMLEFSAMRKSQSA